MNSGFGLPKNNKEAPRQETKPASTQKPETLKKPLQSAPISPSPLAMLSPTAFSIVKVPARLLEVFRELRADPVLSGGSAVQVWTGRTDGDFETHDLDFITHLWARDFEPFGITRSDSGRHIEVDGVAIEFPAGPLGVGDLDLDPQKDTLLVPTSSGEHIRCIRPEASVLDRLALVANDQTSSAFFQASAIVVAQSESPHWDQAWIDHNAPIARLGRLWEFLKTEVAHPSSEGLNQALSIGWDPL